MDIGVPSRFACLKIEDDESRSSSARNKKQPAAKKVSTSDNKKSSSANNKTKLQSSKKASKAKPKETKQQWEDWKKKDDELVNDNFEEDLKCALLQSKLDYEKQKRNVVSTEKVDNTNVKKKKGKTTMSLDQFLDNGNTAENEAKGNVSNKNEENGDFFDDMLEKAKTEITREKVEENRRKRNEDMEKVISVAHYQEKLEEEMAKNVKLQVELSDARKEISRVKKRNTTLCSMLSQGEMKEKAEVLLELERLKNVKEELTEEVARLHKLLEQERSNKASSIINSETHSAKHTKDKHIKKKKN